MREFGFISWSLVPAMTLVTRNAALSVPHHRFNIYSRIFDIIERECSQNLMFLRITDVELPVSRRYAEIILISDLRSPGSEEKRFFVGAFHAKGSIYLAVTAAAAAAAAAANPTTLALLPCIRYLNEAVKMPKCRHLRGFIN
jgi:hypothetical protein